ncbi:hypothetical protein SAY87_001969 [Trapa incisa]|uniref:Uncharacterized protein n=1 Tax=Trapa incisa TaxID=236973 RepID=A0AAN7JW92_9MYRT|nr:hypothetical protein SAY87_001969 [Trapa incisa]
MPVGNVAGYGLGTILGLHRFLPFTKTVACDLYCANIKTLFLVDIVLLAAIVSMAFMLVGEVPLMVEKKGLEAFFSQFSGAFRNLTAPYTSCMLLKRTNISDRKWWGVVNLLPTVCLALTFPVTHVANRFHRLHGPVPPPKRIKDRRRTLNAFPKRIKDFSETTPESRSGR